MSQIKPKSYVIIGLGETGLSCVDYLSKKDAKITVMDTRKNPPNLDKLHKNYPDISVHLGGLERSIMLGADELIVSPGIDLKEPVIQYCLQQGLSVIGDVELFLRENKTKLIAITGSNGKSTVTRLLGDMILASGQTACVAGNIGTPVLTLLEQKPVDWIVLELSSFQLESIYSLNAVAATVLNISEDHQDRYNTMNDYVAAKRRIYINCQTAIVNGDEPITYDQLPESVRKVSFGLEMPGEFSLLEKEEKIYLAQNSNPLISTDELKLKGRHNWGNALAALALGIAINLPMRSMLEALRCFHGLPHRCEWIANINQVDWYNDSKATNVGASIAAVEGLGNSVPGKIILIAGGQSKGADFSALKESVANYVSYVILLGEAADKLQQTLSAVAKTQLVNDMQQAVALAHELAQPNDLVLLAPACASLDMFDNFMMRGESFRGAVGELMT